MKEIDKLVKNRELVMSLLVLYFIVFCYIKKIDIKGIDTNSFYI